jgi:hypothetical protein
MLRYDSYLPLLKRVMLIALSYVRFMSCHWDDCSGRKQKPGACPLPWLVSRYASRTPVHPHHPHLRAHSSTHQPMITVCETQCLLNWRVHVFWDLFSNTSFVPTNPFNRPTASRFSPEIHTCCNSRKPHHDFRFVGGTSWGMESVGLNFLNRIIILHSK